MQMDIKKILVTGANGQLGNELRLMSENFPQFEYLFTDVAELDICNAEAVNAFVEQNKVDAIINCAAYTAVDKAENEEQKAAKINSEAPANLAVAIGKRGGALVQISTDYVFPGNAFEPINEDCATAPTSAYARDLARAIMQILAKGVVPGVYHFTDEGVASWYDFTKMIHKYAGIDSCKVSPLHTSDYPTPATRPHYSVLDKTKIKKTFDIEIPYWADSVKECVDILLKQENNQ